ncbi:MAG: DUF4494 domain-containing protein [Mariniphaga sp.]
MNTWFECTAKYIKMDENSREKSVGETYLLDAISFTEAESRIYKELQTMVSGEFMVTKISKTRISEIIPSDNGDRWYKARVAFITVDEESGKEKRVAQFILVCSNNVKEAYDQIIEAMQGMMADFEISGINESTILDVFPYQADKNEVPGHLKPVSSLSPSSDFQDEPDFGKAADSNHDINDDLDPISEE